MSTLLEERLQLLSNRIDESLLYIVNSNNQNLWELVESQLFNYFIKHISNSPWSNQLGLNILCLVDRNLLDSSVYNLTSTIHSRLKLIFEACNLIEFNDFNYTHVEKYMMCEIIETHSSRQRQIFLTAYTTFTFNINKWIHTNQSILNKDTLIKYVLPELPFDNRDFAERDKAIESAKIKRKAETSVLTPLLPQVRAEGQHRWNQLKRLRNILKELIASSVKLPYRFSYNESEHVNETWTFILWDIDSFSDKYEVYSSKDNFHFLEFVSATKIDTDEEGEGPWFLDILSNNLLGVWDNEYLSKEEREQKLAFLNTWGHLDTDSGTAPFTSRNKGLLTQSVYIVRNSKKLNKLLINLEPIYAACTFAKFALDICTSTGARINELLQVSFDKQCCIKLTRTMNDQTYTNFLFRLVPKGRDEPENYFVPESVFEFINEVRELIDNATEIKGLQKVEYTVGSRKKLFSPRKYIFQYEGKHINEFTLSSIIKFLLHGIIIETAEGKPVVIKTHLIRHAFATHAVHTDKLPIDIVKELLHQKNVEITEYYSAPTQQQITENITLLHENWMSNIDIQQAIIRSPKEIQEIYSEYSEKVGTMAKVLGGICTTDSICPSRFSCVGCSFKVPQPEFKDDLKSYITWCEEQEQQYTSKGYTLEAKKHKIAKQRAMNELKEIQLIERTKIDGEYKPKIN